MALAPLRGAFKGSIYEYACHEGNYSLAEHLGRRRAQERSAAAPLATAGDAH